MYEGTAVAGIPTHVSRGILEGWYRQNGITLGNPRLGFVCVSQTMDGGLAAAGLAGYFWERDAPIRDDERLLFRPEEDGDMPPFDREKAPKLEQASWPAERLARAARNYAVEYVRNLLPVLAQMVGQHEAASLGNLSARLVGMSYHDAVCDILSTERGGDAKAGPAGCAWLVLQFVRGCGDDATMRVEGGGAEEVAFISMTTWRMVRGLGAVSTSVFDGWKGLIEGLVAIHDRFVRFEVVKRLDEGDSEFLYRFTQAKPRPKF
ncbi:hypothetical protein DFJ74DRAFT_705863 [Hyaloraphidium curvatum]|nr:hypothetical protein DFJ74DRAFT_705863 [Hyaloraphidium curvatum]